MKQQSNTALYIILSFISPVFLAWALSQTNWGVNPPSTSNKGILITRGNPWQVINPQKDDQKLWRIMVFPNNASQCSKLIAHADASIVLQREHSKRVKLILPVACNHNELQSAYEASDLTDIQEQTTKYFVTNENSIEYMIVDPLGYAVMAYTHDHADKALVTDLKTLLKYSKVG